MATHTWIGSNGGTAPWDVAANWSDDTLPVAGDSEIFDQPFGSTVTFDSQTETLNNGTIAIETGGVSFSVSSQTTVNGITTALQGTLSNDGLVLVGSNAAFVIRAGSMSNNATIALADTGAQLASYAAANANQGTISIGQNDAFTLYGGDFSNTGVVEARAGSTITIAGGGIGSLATVTNTGTILMNNSTLFLNGVADVAQTVNSTTGSENSLLLGDLGGFGAIALNGTIQVGSVFNRVEVSEASISSGTIAFDGSGTLALDTFRTINSQGSISATIEGFGTNDAFDLTQINAPSLFVTYTTGTLGIWDALGLVGTLDLVGSYTASEFQFKPDGNGGTDIVFNAPPSDPKADILFQNTSGPLALWQISGTTIVGGGLIGQNPGPTWFAMGTGAFFTGDTSDVVWQNQNGQVALWQVQGTSLLGGGLVANNPGPTWHIMGTGDFFGDGNTDILWQNDNGSVALWDMSGTNIVGGGLAASDPGPTWHIEGTGDFFGDGNTTILFQNDDGSVALWDMNGTSIIGGGLVANPGPTWQIKGTGDFYGDGHTDILWQNDNGSVAIWEMNGTSIIGGGLVSDPGPTWHIKGTGDFNNDGHTDISFQNDNGTVAIWEINGSNIIGGGVVANPGTGWNLLDNNMRFTYSASANETLAATPASQDEFVFTSFAAGSHMIGGFNPVQDMIEFSKAQFASVTDVQAATSAVSGGAMINLGNGSSLLLPGVDAGALHTSNFVLA